MSAIRPRTPVGIAAILLWLLASDASAYSVLAHETTVDVSWNIAIRPLLLQRFPRTTTAELDEARAFAYGGSVIQDLGYYPFGTKFFSNLLHYVRSGDFVESLLRQARDVNELAFAVGALAHYANDNAGHPEAVNLAVPMIFPKLKARYGDRVTYVQAPKQHVIVEFSFDIVQAAAGAYPPDAYRRFIGFEVAEPLLERAFLETYGLELTSVLTNGPQALASYRYSVSQLVPALTDAAWRDKREEIQKLFPDVDRNRFVFRFPRAEYERAYGNDYARPGWFARFLGFLYRLVPKVGPLKPLSFKAPTPEAQAFFAASFKDATMRLQASIATLGSGGLQLPNTNFDTGTIAAHRDYGLADDTYAELLSRWADAKVRGMPAPLRTDVLRFYGEHPSAPLAKYDRKHWHDTVRALAALRTAGPARRATASLLRSPAQRRARDVSLGSS